MDQSGERKTSWAVQSTDTYNRSRQESDENYSDFPQLRNRTPKTDRRDLRHRLSRSRNDSHQNESKYTQRDGLSPLRSPINGNSDQHPTNGSANGSSHRETRSQRNGKSRYPKTGSSPQARPRLRPDTNEDESPTKKSPMKDRNSGNRFRRRLNLPSADDEEKQPRLRPASVEEDKIAVLRREKQISYGKNTDAYKLYVEAVPKDARGPNRREHPRTPDKLFRCSRRNFDAQIKSWKLHLHEWAHKNKGLVSESASETSQKVDEERESEDLESLSLGEEDEDFLDGFDLEVDPNECELVC